MWATLQDQSFLLGAVLVTLVHATKFGELNLANPVTGRYLALLPGAKVRDFVGPYAYHVALLAFLSVSLVAYYLACQISPDILKGAIKLFSDADPETAIRGVPYPLYVAGLFIGLTQPIIPVFRVSERPNGTFSTTRSKYLNASSISPRDWLATSRRARGRTNGFWQEKCETSSAATFSRLCKPTATSLFTSCSSSGSISMTQPLSRTPSRRAQRRSYGDSSSELLFVRWSR